MEIKGFIETSFIDWPGRICAVVFLGRCNFRCPFCHNHPLVLEHDKMKNISLDEVVLTLNTLRKWLGGICVSGGEPTLNPHLPELLRQFKLLGYEIKLDTNGTNPDVVEHLLADGLVDMISMDVKAPLDQEKYSRCAGLPVKMDNIHRSIELIRNSDVNHEFRMTVLPRFHTEADIIEWKQFFGDDCTLKLQNFNPATTLDPALQQEKGFDPDTFSSLQGMITGRTVRSERLYSEKKYVAF